jgi:hypothetical protein
MLGAVAGASLLVLATTRIPPVAVIGACAALGAVLQ